MADGSAPEISTQQPTKAESRSSKIWNSIREKFEGKRNSPQNNFRPEQFAEFIDYPPNKKFTVSGFISAAIREKGLKSPVFESKGASGFAGTNEKVNPQALREVKESDQSPNGYIVGVGVPNIFTMLDAFPDGVEPKGIVMVNIDPDSVSKAKIFLEELGKGRLVSFIGSGRSLELYDETDKRPRKPYSLEEGYEGGRDKVDVDTVMRKHADMLIKMARSGKISLVQQDILDSSLLASISELPDFKTSNNVIYLSNIADWMYREPGFEAWKRRVEHYNKSRDPHPQIPPYEIDEEVVFGPINNNLALLQTDGEHVNYFADTLTKKSGLNYSLRISPHTPKFTKDDFSVFDL